ncbi:hypothetical protein [Streptomyces sp. NBC_00996]|uniref:hypothetical protein n=1 Tax=Streptomyces sp. NBC_00996 TaxID=2903710 RepID=UPI003870C9BB|nr:hypothetical protein OG390_17275 [Streptomyces sp. NBC_00996]
MITSSTGRDGRALVTTTMAAYSLGMKPASFRSWARRHGVTAADYQRTPGSTGQAGALWDLADLTSAMRTSKAA